MRQPVGLPLERLHVALGRVPRAAVFSGLTAAWLHGLDVEPCAPVEVTLPLDGGVSGRAGLRVRRTVLSAEDVTTARGLPATTVERTLAGLCAQLSLTEAVVLADAATHLELTTCEALAELAHSSAYRWGLSRFRRVVELVEPLAESPMETRLRMVMIRSGLPRPIAQHTVVDGSGRFLARLDLFYPEAMLGIEYDGVTHNNSLAEDDRRQNGLVEAGIRLLRFTSADVYGRPDSLVAEVRGMLQLLPAKVARESGAPKVLPAKAV
ncbi:MAG TPA: DUF559 domain-containing protein [Candidatus Dormibacteraeota bacterium]